jgi:hypothetical protein
MLPWVNEPVFLLRDWRHTDGSPCHHRGHGCGLTAPRLAGRLLRRHLRMRAGVPDGEQDDDGKRGEDHPVRERQEHLAS